MWLHVSYRLHFWTLSLSNIIQTFSNEAKCIFCSGNLVWAELLHSLKYLENKRTQKRVEKIKPAKLLPISFNQLSVLDSSENISLIVWPWRLATVQSKIS